MTATGGASLRSEGRAHDLPVVPGVNTPVCECRVRPDDKAARIAYTVAYELEPRPEILINLGKVCYSQGATKRAARFFAQAVLLDARMMKEVPEDFRDKVSDALRSQDDSYGADED